MRRSLCLRPKYGDDVKIVAKGQLRDESLLTIGRQILVAINVYINIVSIISERAKEIYKNESVKK